MRRDKADTAAGPTDDLGVMFRAYPGTKDIRLHPVYQGRLSQWIWRFYTHRLTRSGRWLLALSTIVALSASVSLDVQMYVPLLYIGGLWFVAIVAALLNRPRVAIRARHADRIRSGEILSVEVEVTQTSLRLPGLELSVLPARLPLALDAVPPDGVPVGMLRPGESRRVRLGISCPRRGAFRFWGFRVESDFPFGLLNAYRYVAHESAILVYPAFSPLERMEIPSGRRFHPGGVALASHLGDSFEYLGNREYREGDNVRDIDWRATARLGGEPLALREYREEFFLRVGVVLDTFLPRGGRMSERAARHAAFERAVSISAALADYLARQDYIIDIFAAGPNLYHLTAGRSLAYLEQILDILACVGSSTEEPLEIVEPQIQEYLARLTTIICVFVEWNATRERFVDNLRASGAGVKVILVSGPGIATGAMAGFPPDTIVIEPDAFASGVEEL